MMAGNMLHIISSQKAINSFLADIKSGNGIILTGAGISIRQPSNLPSGPELKEIIIDNILNHPGLRAYKTVIKKNPKYEAIVPEVLFQEIYSVMGSKIFTVYKILELCLPNKTHQILAYLADHYNTKIYTTNFDLLIDQLLSQNQNVVHLHGSLHDPAKMTVLINQVGKGVQSSNQVEFGDSLKGKNLYVFGYSGNDRDIIDLINTADIPKVYWLARDLNNEWMLKNISKIKPDCYIFKSDLPLFFNTVTSRLALSFRNYRSKDYAIEKKAISRSFNKQISPFERFAALENIFFRLQEYDLAYEISRDAFKYGIIQNTYQKLWFLIFMSDTINVVGKEFSKGLKLVKDGLSDRELNKYPFLKGQLLNQQGIFFIRSKKSDPRNALASFTLALSTFEEHLKKTSDPVETDKTLDYIGRLHHNIGYCYYVMSQSQQAVSAFRRALRYKAKRGDLLGLTSTQVNLSLQYLKTGNNDRFRYWEGKAIELIDKYNFHYQKAYLLREKGRILCDTYSDKNGVIYLNDALSIYQQHLPSAKYDITLTLKAIKNCR